MTELYTEIEIRATPAKVWQILMDFPAYPQWNPLIQQAEGQPLAGKRISITIVQDRWPGMRLRPRILRAEPEQELRWRGQLGLPGLFDGEHFFRIEPLAPNRVRFVQAERFSGALVPFFTWMINGSTRRGFEALNRALKDRAEQD